MNIAIVTTWEERGAAYVSKQYIDALSSIFSVRIFARGGNGRSNSSDYFQEKDCYRSKASNKIYSTYIRKNEFVHWLNKNAIQVVFFNEQNWWPPVVWCKEMNLITGAYVDYYTEKTIPLFEIYDFIICNTVRHYKAFNWHPNSFYIPWGTDVNLFKPETKKNNYETIFFHSCGMSPDRKGTDLLLKAYIDLPTKSKKLIIHSQKPLEEYASFILHCKKETLKKEKIHFIEKTVPAPGLYHLGHIYVYPTRLEGIGLTILEALSCGLPVIAPDDPPMNEFVSNERGKLVKLDRNYSRSDGYYWPMNLINLEDLKSKMKYYIENPRAIKNESDNAREFALKKLDWKKQNSMVVEIFKSSFAQPFKKCENKCQKILAEEKSLISKVKRLISEVDGLLNRVH